MLYVGEGLRGNNATCSTLSQLSVPSPTTHKQIGPFWCSFLGGWACVCSRTLGVSPSNSHVRLGVSPTATTPTGFFSQKFLRLYFPGLEPWVTQSVSLPNCSSSFIHTQKWDYQICQPLPCSESSPLRLPVCAPPTGLDECFFFNSLVMRLSYSLIFCQFGGCGVCF